LSKACCTPFSGDISGDGGILRFAGNLVNFVNIDDSPLCPLHIIVGSLDQLEEDILHILSHISGFSKGGGIGDGKGHMQDPS
jgi:hypothetical protein